MMYGGSEPYHRLRRPVDQQPLLDCCVDDRRRRTIQIQSPHQPGAPDLANHRVTRLKPRELRLHVRADARDVSHQSAGHELVEEHQRRPAGQQVAAIRAAVIAERGGRCHALAEERRGNRNACTERLADRHQVRLQADARRAKCAPRSA